MKGAFEQYLVDIENEIRESLNSCYTNDQIDLFFTHLELAQFPLSSLKEQRQYEFLEPLVADFLDVCKRLDLIELRMVFYELYRQNQGQYSLDKVNNKLRIRQFEVFDLCFNIEVRLNKLKAQLKGFKDIGYIPKNYDQFEHEISQYTSYLKKLGSYANKSDSELLQDYDDILHIYTNALKYYEEDLEEWVKKVTQEDQRMTLFTD